MVEDEHYADLVRTIFRRYGIEGWSMRAIVRWLNSPETLATHPNPEGETGQWNRPTISRMLRKRVYLGEVEWGKTKDGYYDRYDGPVLRSGEGDCGPARHEALIERLLWEAVQARLANEEPRRTTVTRKGRRPALLSGILVCSSCDGPMRALHRTPAVTSAAQRSAVIRKGWSQYVCVGRERKQSDCSEPDCSMRVADAAVLREVSRLHPGRPWTPSAPHDLAVQDPHAAERARLEAQVASARREVEANNRLLRLLALEGDPGQEALDAFRRDQQKLDREIKAKVAQLEALPHTTVDPVTIEKLHAALAGADLAAEIARAQERGDAAGLRRLVGMVVESARITQRAGGARNGRTGWMRAQVVWTPPRRTDLVPIHGLLLRTGLVGHRRASWPVGVGLGDRGMLRAVRAARRSPAVADLPGAMPGATGHGLAWPARTLPKRTRGPRLLAVEGRT
jgi:hypothetical protein